MTSEKVFKRVLKYTAVFEPAEEGGFVATIPALPGCTTQGETFEETVSMIQDAISGYVQILKDEKLEVPMETEDAVFTKVSVSFPFQFAT